MKLSQFAAVAAILAMTTISGTRAGATIAPTDHRGLPPERLHLRQRQDRALLRARSRWRETIRP